MSVKKMIVIFMTLIIICVVIGIVMDRARIKTAMAATKSADPRMAEAGSLIKEVGHRIVSLSDLSSRKGASQGILSPLMQAELIKLKAALALGSIIIGSIAFHSILDRSSNRDV